MDRPWLRRGPEYGHAQGVVGDADIADRPSGSQPQRRLFADERGERFWRHPGRRWPPGRACAYSARDFPAGE